MKRLTKKAWKWPEMNSVFFFFVLFSFYFFLPQLVKSLERTTPINLNIFKEPSGCRLSSWNMERISIRFFSSNNRNRFSIASPTLCQLSGPIQRGLTIYLYSKLDSGRFVNTPTCIILTLLIYIDDISFLFYTPNAIYATLLNLSFIFPN